MATVQRYVNTASTAGGDGTTNATSGANRAYASLSEWEANAGGVATDDYIVDCAGTAADTAQVTVDFTTNITTGSITIRANAGDAAGKYNGPQVISTNHYRLAVGDVSFDAIRIQETRTTIDGIQVTYGYTGNFGICVYLTAANVTIKNCRLLGTVSTIDLGIGTGTAIGYSSVTCTNNLVVNFDVSGIAFIVDIHFSPTIDIYHNTVYNANAGTGIRTDRASTGTGNPTVRVKANAVSNCAAASCIVDAGTRGTYTAEDNATEDTTGQIQNIVDADSWTSPGTTSTSDFTVKNTSSALYNVVNPTLLTTDITGFTRDGTNHDAGAFELQAATSRPRYLTLMGVS